MRDQRAGGNNQQERTVASDAKGAHRAQGRDASARRIGPLETAFRRSISAERTIATPMTGWTLERRAHQAVAIRRWAPWIQSTGPRTAIGKARSARNAFQGGNRAWWRAVAVVFSIYRKRPGAKTIEDCEGCQPLSARERAALRTYALLCPAKILVGGKVRE